MADSALDVPYQRWLVGCLDDDEGFYWLHRIRLLRGSGQKWFWLTPDGETQYADFGGRRVVCLRRAAPFPNQHLGNFYAFDEMEDDVLTERLADSRALATIFGFDGKSQVGDTSDRWYVPDALSEHYVQRCGPQRRLRQRGHVVPARRRWRGLDRRGQSRLL